METAFNVFIPKPPRTYTVTANNQTLLATIKKNPIPTVLIISNNSSDKPVYLGWTSLDSEIGNAQVHAGITVWPKSNMEFVQAVPVSCKVWATCESGTADVGVQQ